VPGIGKDRPAIEPCIGPWLLRKPIFSLSSSMNEESDSKTYEERAWQYFLQLQPSIADVNAAAELAFRAVDAFDKVLKRKRG
jgi:hypothetical protein